MRIRKRKVPLPLSLLSPIPLSDPHLFSRSPVTAEQGGASTSAGEDTSIITSSSNTADFHSQPPSDHFTCPDTSSPDLHRPIVGNSDTGVKQGDEGQLPTSNDDASKASVTTSTRSGAVQIMDDDNIINNNNAVEMWCDGQDKAIPLKKRRGISFNHIVENKNTTKVDQKNTMEIVSRKGNTNTNTNTKRGNTIMEGSRCSRVNGRGWRCCQPTLVGYSLCEHHLGKGRLRNMTNNNLKKKKKSSSSNGYAFALGRRDECSDERVEDEDDEKRLETKRSSFGNSKRVKLGVVKARSLSSLLSQESSTMSSLDDAIEAHEKVIVGNVDHSMGEF